MTIRFGPAGLGAVETACRVLGEYVGLGIKACEIAFTYSVYIKPDDAIIIGKKAKELGIELSVHAPYFINLNSDEKEKREASKKRILDCCKIGELLEAKLVVFHPGFYGKDKEKAYESIKQEVSEIIEIIKRNEWKIKIAPETMGKINVFGSIEEIARLVGEAGCSFCLDFAHILAREKKVDWEKIEKLFPQKKWHAHFSGVEYVEKGEKHHKTTSRKEWEELLKNLPKDKEIVIINESPTMIDDCIEEIEVEKEINY